MQSTNPAQFIIRVTFIFVFTFALVLTAQGQDVGPTANKGPVVEEIFVTGTYLKRKSQFDSASPLEVIDDESLLRQNISQVSQIPWIVPANTGSQNNPDGFTQAFTSGTTNFNLRGLGVNNTLVLVNGNRTVNTPAATNRGLNFVDLSTLIPASAIQRVEILKDGASSTYGSDAVAGVVNFITRDDYRGLEVDFEYQTTTDDDQDDWTISGIWGTGSDNIDFVIAGSYLSRDPLHTEDRVIPTRQDTSLAGQPGSYLVVTRPAGPDPVTIGTWDAAYDNANMNGIADFAEGIPGALAPVLADPDCQNVANSLNNNLGGAVPPTDAQGNSTFPAGFCQFDFGGYFDLVPDEERLLAWTKLTWAINDQTNLYGEVSYGDNSVERRNSPSFPVAQTQAVQDTHPDNPYGVSVLNLGRALGVGMPPVIANYDYRTTRVVGGFDIAFSERLALDVHAGWSKNDYDVIIPETIGGCGAALPTPTCTVPILPPPVDQIGLEEPYSLSLLGLSGVPGNPFFNPFGSSNSGFGGTPNDPAVINNFLSNYTIDAWTELTTVDVVLTSDVWDMGGGPAGLAVGGQWRDEEAKYDYDDISNFDNFLFLIGNQDWQASRDVIAAFAELGLPFAESFDLTLAVRWEDYGSGLDSTDPKIAALWRPIDVLTFRGSFSTSFSVPSLFQENGSQTIVENIFDPLFPAFGQQFKAVRSLSDPTTQLTPQEADIYNLGLSWAATDNLEFGLDYWRFDVTDVIIQESAQGIVSANPGDPRIQRDTNVGLILRVDVANYTNASSLDTDGIDFTGAWNLDDTSSGSWRFGLAGTYTMSYDIVDPQAGAVDGAGNRNFTNFATSVPELRGNLNATWSLGRSSVNAYLRYIDSYDDDQNPIRDPATGLPILDPVTMNPVGFAKVDSFTAFDLQYNFEFNPIFGAETGPVITLGAINLFDEEVPGVVTSGGFDSKVHDPRQRLVYLRMALPFQ